MKLITKTLIAGLLCSSAVTLCPGIGRTHHEYLGTVSAQLKTFFEVAADRGFSRTHDVSGGQLQDNQYESRTLSLRAGRDYRIAAFCDQDCQDIDLVVFDENGNRVARDVSGDDTPIVSISPRWSGSFTVRVGMADCQSSTCYYGVGVSGR